MNNQFNRFTSLIGDENFKKITNSSVAVIGVGGVGGVAAMTLARCGIGNFVIQDFDIVSETNINRQVVANYGTLGELKVDVLEKMIYSVNPDARVIKISEKYTADTASNLFVNKIDFLIDAIDDLEAKFILIKNCLKRNINFISSGGAAKKYNASRLRVIEISKTTYDPVARILRKKLRDNNINDKIYIVSSDEEAQKGDILGSYMPVTASAGLMLADYVIKQIIGW